MKKAIITGMVIGAVMNFAILFIVLPGFLEELKVLWYPPTKLSLLLIGHPSGEGVHGAPPLMLPLIGAWGGLIGAFVAAGITRIRAL